MGYDWRKVEARLNALPQFVTTIDGVDIHFVHVRSKNRNALPVIITHGWPGSIVEQLKIIDPLTNPTAHGGSASDAFDVVIPSLPGYGFSGQPTTPGWDPAHIARAWTVLMKRLGYRQHLGLSALPSPNEDMPLVLPIGATAANGGTQTCAPLTRAALHAIVKEVFARAAARLRERDETSAARADLLEKASTHWLRHSAGSHMADRQIDLRMVRDTLGHASLTTTSLYLHIDDDRRHQETDEKHRIDW